MFLCFSPILIFLASFSTVTLSNTICNCTQVIDINLTNPNVTLDNFNGCLIKNCVWRVNFNGSRNGVDYYVLHISYSSNDIGEILEVAVCNTDNILNQNMAPNVFDIHVYTQESEICINFTTDLSVTPFYNISFLLENPPNSTQNFILEPSEPIKTINLNINEAEKFVTSSNRGRLQLYLIVLTNNLDYTILDDCNGIFYIYGSSYFKNYLGSFIYNCQSSNDEFVRYIANSSTISLFYVGTALAYGYVQQVYRVVDEHTANCIVQDNLIYASPATNHINNVKNINASSMGHCLYTIVVPVIDDNKNLPALEFISMNYSGSSNVKVVTGYNDTYTLLEYGDNDAKFWNNVIVSGNLITLIIPPRGSLDISFQITYGNEANDVMDGNIGNKIYTRKFKDNTICDILMSSDYPIFNDYDNDSFKRKTVTCLSGFANFNITIVYADLRNGILQFNYSTTSTIYENRIVTNELLSFTADQMTISAGSYESWNGFLLRYEASYVNEEKTNKTNFIIVGSFVGVGVISLIAIGVLIYYLRKRGKEKQRLEGICDILTDMQMTKDDLIGFKEKTDELFIKDSNIFINFDKILGQGSCSSVYYGFLKGPSPLHLKMQMIETQRFGDCDVAVKVARNIGENELEQLYKEITVMKTLGYHENLMCMLGWTMPSDKPCLIFDIAKIDLLHYVRGFRNANKEELPWNDFVSILWQITRGMQYIVSKGMVHRDLAARNILLFGSNIAKISDFGLCCKCDETFTYKATLQKKLPIRWLSIEALTDHIFSEKSDVWSFGILMYEMFTLGQVPYASLCYDEMVELLKSGQRLEHPQDMPEELYKMAKKCWEESAQDRLNFTELEENFHAILESEVDGYESFSSYLSL